MTFSPPQMLARFPRPIVAALCVAMTGALGIAHLYAAEQMSLLPEQLFHSLHGPGFAVVALFVFWSLEAYRSTLANYVYSAGASISIGILAEVAQVPGPRDADIADIVVDAIGACAGLSAAAAFDSRVTQRLGSRFHAIIRIVAVVAVAGVSLPSLWFGYAWIAQNANAAEILTFERPWEHAIIDPRHGERPDVIAAPRGWPLPGKIGHARESGGDRLLLRVSPYPDWTGYRTLRFFAASGDGAEAELQLTVTDHRLHGESHGVQFTRRIHVDADPAVVTIDLDALRKTADWRPFDSTGVNSIRLNAVSPGRGTTLLFDDFRLE
jgi:VanZ family protein